MTTTTYLLTWFAVSLILFVVVPVLINARKGA